MSALAQILAACGGLPSDFRGYMTPGTYSFTVPADVSSLCALALGAGGGSSDIKAGGGYGGGGGALAYSNNISVTPGEVLTIVVGDGGTRGVWPGGASPGAATSGGYSSLARGGTTLVLAAGGTGGSGSAGIGGVGSAGTGDTTLSGSNGAAPSGTELRGGGGGYSAFPSRDGFSAATSTTNYRGGARGGSLYLFDGGSDSQAAYPNAAGYHGEGWAGANQNYHGFGAGGGAFGDSGKTLIGQGAAGAPGAVILIWGGREFSTSSIF